MRELGRSVFTFMSSTFLVVLLALSEDDSGYACYTVKNDNSEDWDMFVDRANALLKTSLTAHVCLVRAAVAYGTAGKEKTPERRHLAEAVEAFMGDGFDPSELGTWTLIEANKKSTGLSDLFAANEAAQAGNYEKTFVFVNAENRSDADY